VLKVLGNAAVNLRGKLGESLRSVRKYDTPWKKRPHLHSRRCKHTALAQAFADNDDNPTAASFFRGRFRLDPNFAIAYANLAMNYRNLNENSWQRRTRRKLTSCGDGLSEREKLNIEAFYYQLVTADLEKACRVYELWGQTYREILFRLPT